MNIYLINDEREIISKIKTLLLKENPRFFPEFQ